MHHFRGKLFQGAEIRLDPANIYIQYRAPEGEQGQGWYGYLLVDSETAVEPRGTYTLKLMDGRAGQLRIDEVSVDESGKLRATFFGEGSLG